MLGNLLQQLYNIVDTLIVGRFLGENALAAVGSSYSLMLFLTSILLGLCMGSSSFFSIQYGKREMDTLKNSMFLSFVFIFLISILLNILVFTQLDFILSIFHIPHHIYEMTRDYLFYVLIGIMATFLFNFFSFLLRSIGDSLTPLIFLGISCFLNIGLDLLFIVIFKWGVVGAAIATTCSQYFSGVGIMIYSYFHYRELRLEKKHLQWDCSVLKEIISLSSLTCLQQSIMNFGILMVQGLINSFGTVVMAAFAAAIKIDSLAYMPVQDFGNAFSTFIAQNYGAQEFKRIRQGIKSSVITVFIFSTSISFFVFIFAANLMKIFIDPSNTEVIRIGVEYLHIEGAFYFGIGLLFMLYGYYRAISKPSMSIVLTIFSLGTRVLLAYSLAPLVGTWGIWISVPIGWILADLIGVVYFLYLEKKKT